MMKSKRAPMDIKQLDYRKRQLLKCSAYAFLLTASGSLPVVSQLATHGDGKHRSDLNPSLGSMQAIGREYLEKYPVERSQSTLLSLLESSTGSKGDGLYDFSWGGLRTAITDDFRTEDVVFLNDWCLSRTEARLCALAVV